MTSTTRKTPAASAADEPTLDGTSTPEQSAETSAESAPAAAIDVEPAAAAAPAAAPAEPVADPNYVVVKLAHPLDKPEDLRRLGLEPKTGGYKVHDAIRVTKDNARMLITAGYAQVDPEDDAAVTAALNPAT